MLDCGFLSRRVTRAARIALDPAEAGRASFRHSSRSRRHSSAKAAGIFVFGANVLRGRVTPEQCARQPISPIVTPTGICATHHAEPAHCKRAESTRVRVAGELTTVGLPCALPPLRVNGCLHAARNFGKLALTETKSFARWLTEELDQRLPVSRHSSCTSPGARIAGSTDRGHRH